MEEIENRKNDLVLEITSTGNKRIYFITDIIYDEYYDFNEDCPVEYWTIKTKFKNEKEKEEKEWHVTCIKYFQYKEVNHYPSLFLGIVDARKFSSGEEKKGSYFSLLKRDSSIEEFENFKF
jgi:hypothetical protein